MTDLPGVNLGQTVIDAAKHINDLNIVIDSLKATNNAYLDRAIRAETQLASNNLQQSVNKRPLKVNLRYIHETTLQSIERDIFTLLMIVAIGVAGYLLHSSALQWFGVVGFLIYIATCPDRYNSICYTLAEARDELNKIEIKMKDN